MPGPLVFFNNPLKTRPNGIAVSGADTASAAVVLPPGDGQQLLVINEGPTIAFGCVSPRGDAAVLPTAAPKATCMPFPVGIAIYTLQPGDNFISVICRSGTTAVLSVYVINGV